MISGIFFQLGSELQTKKLFFPSPQLLLQITGYELTKGF